MMLKHISPVTTLFTLLFSAAMMSAAAAALKEPPILEPMVQSGELPPMSERLPEQPLKVNFDANGRTIGRYCCSMEMLMGKAKDIRLMTVYGYARLVGFDENFALKPDILEKFEADEGRIFTLHLRKGHKWSDGHPFTAEDFRYYWDDVVNNEELTRAGLPQVLLSNGKPPKFEVIDEHTVRYTWEDPNPAFPLGLAYPRATYIYKPAHFMKQYHPAYTDRDELEKKAKELGYRNWAAMHTGLGRQYRPENPEMPTLQPWHNTTAGPSKRMVFQRNPYYHRVDPDGQQLPYIDEVVLLMGSTDIVPAKTGAGESDLQARYLRFDNFTFLKEGEANQGYRVLPWRAGIASQISLYPNLNYKDEAWRELFQNREFRRALSIGVNRNELNEQLFFGMAKPGADTVLEASPLYKESLSQSWTQHDTELANKMLDDLGLQNRNAEGTRLLPDGRPMEIIIESAGESTEQTDALELIRYHWDELGIRIFSRSLQRDIHRRRFLTGETMMTISKGLNIGLATPDLNPEELAPVSPAQPNWPVWGQYTQTGGKAGEPPSLPSVKRLLELYNAWRASTNDMERESIWSEMLEIYSEEVFSIGTTREVIQPVVINSKLQNVPETGIYSWAPSSFFGVYRPDTFWFAE